MASQQILQTGSQFAGYRIKQKLSCRYDGEREVYLAVDPEGNKVALIIFNLDSTRYRDFSSTSEKPEDFIPEIWMCTKIPRPIFTPVLATGIESMGGKRIAWMAKQYAEGKTLTQAIFERGCFTVAEATEIAIRIMEPLPEFCYSIGARPDSSGYIRNLTTDNIIVNYEDGVLKDIRIVGLSVAGGCYEGRFSEVPHYKVMPKVSLDVRFCAPEMFYNSKDHSTDEYSVGMIMLHMILGRKVFEYAFSAEHSEEFSRDILINPEAYWLWMWSNVPADVPPYVHRILSMVTQLNYLGRFTMDKFLDLIKKCKSFHLNQTFGLS